MDKKFKRYKVDYAAAYRHYIDFGGGRTLEKFCQDEGYDFEKFKRRIKYKAIPELTHSHLIGWWHNLNDQSIFMLQFNS